MGNRLFASQTFLTTLLGLYPLHPSVLGFRGPEGKSPGQLAASGGKSSGKVCPCKYLKGLGSKPRVRSTIYSYPHVWTVGGQGLGKVRVSNQVDPLPLGFLGQA